MGKFPASGPPEDPQSEQRWLGEAEGHYARCCQPLKKECGPEASCRACPKKCVPRWSKACPWGLGSETSSVGPDWRWFCSCSLCPKVAVIKGCLHSFPLSFIHPPAHPQDQQEGLRAGLCSAASALRPLCTLSKPVPRLTCISDALIYRLFPPWWACLPFCPTPEGTCNEHDHWFDYVL